MSAARAAAVPEKDWRPEAKAVAAPASSDVTWSPDDLHALSVAAQKKNGLTETYARSRIEVDSTGQDTATIAAHGTTYLTKDDKRVRCVARVKNVVKNNVGQPLAADLDGQTMESWVRRTMRTEAARGFFRVAAQAVSRSTSSGTGSSALYRQMLRGPASICSRVKAFIC